MNSMEIPTLESVLKEMSWRWETALILGCLLNSPIHAVFLNENVLWDGTIDVSFEPMHEMWLEGIVRLELQEVSVYKLTEQAREIIEREQS